MIESDMANTAEFRRGDLFMPTRDIKGSPANSSAAELNVHTQDGLQAINHLINELNSAIQATNADANILRGKLAESQQQLQAKDAELQDLKQEAARYQQQLQATQSKLDSKDISKAKIEVDFSASQQQLQAKNAELQELEFSLKDATEENELMLIQLHQAQEELELIFLDRQEKVVKITDLELLFADCRKDWILNQANKTPQVARFVGKKVISMTYAN